MAASDWTSSPYTHAVVAHRAILALADPEGEREAVVPMDEVDVAIVLRWFDDLPRSRPATRDARSVSSRQWDNTDILIALGVPPGRRQAMVHCPLHDDRRPSLSVRLEGDRILLHDFGGCTFEAIMATVTG